jgi:hypothetical protein
MTQKAFAGQPSWLRTDVKECANLGEEVLPHHEDNRRRGAEYELCTGWKVFLPVN